MTDANEVSDYSEHIEGPAVEVFGTLTRMCGELAAAQEEEIKAKAAYDRAVAKVKDLREYKIPDVMAEIGSKEITLADGTKITIKDDIRVSLPKDDRGKRAEAIAWLDANGLAAIVDRQIVITFDKASEARARWVEARLARYKDPLPMTTELSVHPSTLAKMARDRYAEGKSIPKVFSPFPQRVAVVKRGQ